MKKISCICVLFIFCITGCATLQHVSVPVYPDPRPDVGLVYFYRSPAFAGSAISYSVYDGEKKIGALASGTYFFYWAEPGEHSFWAETESKTSRTFTVEPGKVYYIKGDVGFGVFIGAPHITIVNDIEGQAGTKECKYAIVKEEFEKLPKEKQEEIISKEKEIKSGASEKISSQRKEMMSGRRK